MTRDGKTTVGGGPHGAADQRMQQAGRESLERMQGGLTPLERGLTPLTAQDALTVLRDPQEDAGAVDEAIHALALLVEVCERFVEGPMMHPADAAAFVRLIPQQSRESREIVVLARTMADEEFDSYAGTEFQKLATTYGSRRAGEIWQRACESFDYHHSPGEFREGKPDDVIEYG